MFDGLSEVRPEQVAVVVVLCGHGRISREIRTNGEGSTWRFDRDMADSMGGSTHGAMSETTNDQGTGIRCPEMR
jgi:hypothetical protein